MKFCCIFVVNLIEGVCWIIVRIGWDDNWDLWVLFDGCCVMVVNCEGDLYFVFCLNEWVNDFDWLIVFGVLVEDVFFWFG